MKAYRLNPGGGIDGIALVELPDPAPGPGEVLVGVRATSLNYRDLGQVRNNRYAIVPLSDGAGEVLAVGAGVTRFAPGDRVLGCFFPRWPDGNVTPEYVHDALGGGRLDGMLAERVVLPETALVRTPAYLSDEEAATLPCAPLTAWNAMFEETHLRPGETVLLLGTGGVSITALQLAHLAGARTIVTSSSDEKLARVRALGANETVNYRTREDWERAVLDLTGGRGVDLVLEVGGEGTFAKSMASTRIGGTIVLIGGLSGTAASGVPLLGRNLRASRIYVGSRTMFERMNRAFELHEVRPVIDRVFDFAHALDAYRLLESQTHLGRIVIRV